MSTTGRTFTSNADAQGLVTQIIVEPALATVSSIKLLSGQRALMTLTASPMSLFTVRFTKYSLLSNAYALVGGKKQTVEYKVGATTRCDVTEVEGELTLKYPSVSSGLRGFSAIEVTVKLTRPADTTNEGGWIDFDISYTYPTQCVSGDKQTAWEVELIYPEVCFTNTRLSSYLLLDPVGTLGGFVGMAAEERVKRMPLQFAAFYKPGTGGGGVNYLRGVALAATDEQGHAKSLRYRPAKVGRTPARAISFHLTTPIHLKQNAYKRPAGTYTLSGGGADGGFSGAQMHYRLRAFNVNGVGVGAPVDWHDVADIYRDWLNARRPSFYSKYISRYPAGFTYAMSPLTVVSNYGLDGHVQPEETDLAKWLELHPVIVDEKADMPGNNPADEDPNESLQNFLARLKARFGAGAGVRLEAQIWGFEMAGFYQALGAHPPATDVISGAGRFSRAMAELLAQGIIPSVTTDPLNTNFNRTRYRGHLIKDGEEWKAAIPKRFPLNIRTKATENGVVTEAGGNNRQFLALNSADAALTGSVGNTRGSQKLNGDGAHEERFEGLTRFYNIYGRRLCPTPTVQSFYVDTLLKARLFADGFRHVEFMKHNFAFYFCYDRKPGHKHLEGQTAAADYDNVIGQGPWYIKRLQQVLKAAQDAGQAIAGNDFALVNEFIFPETLVPYFDEFYEYDSSSFTIYTRHAGTLGARPAPLFWYVYSPLVSMKMNLADTGPYVHPGYREEKLVESVPAPTYMLNPARDDDTPSAPSYTSWRHQCRLYNDPNFGIAAHGLAPNGYPANTQTGENFTDYTYRRCVEEVFNLKTNIFRYGSAAVLGERIYLFAKLLEGFTEYTDEVINMAVRAAHMQMKFPEFFRGGRMLGQTRVGGNKQLWAWRAHNRQFNDIEPLVNALYTTAEVSGRKPLSLSILDFLSRGVDKLNIVPHGTFDYVAGQEPDLLPMASRVTADRIQHMVWQDATGAALYTFANVGNSDQSVTFLCGRGLNTATTWQRTDYKFAGDPTGAPTARPAVGFMSDASIDIPARTCAAVFFKV